MAKIENDQLIIALDHAEGSVLKAVQEALILGSKRLVVPKPQVVKIIRRRCFG